MLIIFPTETVDAAKRGLLLWYNAALPSLFPFAAGTSLLINLGFVSLAGRLLSPLGKRLFNVSPGGFFVFLSGITSGYPIGIQTLAEMYENRLISKPEALRLSAFAGNCGPLFILGSVGAVMLKSPSAALLILVCHYGAAAALGAVLGIFAPAEAQASYIPKTAKKPFGLALSQSVETACRSMITVGGFIVLFSVITEFIRLSGLSALLAELFRLLGLDKKITESVILGLLEMTNGCALMSQLETPLKLPLICALISFGGFSVMAQSASFLSEKGLPCAPYIKGKLICALLSFFLCLMGEKILLYY